MPKVNLDDLALAIDWAADDMCLGNVAWVCRQSGKVCMYSPEFEDTCDPLPEDFESSDRYLPVPDKYDLDLGNRLAYDFTREAIPGAYDEVRAIFGRRGAWGRFKDFLHYRGLVERWHAYREAQEFRALREWCADNGLEAVDPPRLAAAKPRREAGP